MTISSFHFFVIKKLPIDKQTKRFGHNWYYYWRETHIHTELMNINVRFEHVNVGFHRSLPTLAEPCRTLTRSSRCVMTVSQLPMSRHCQQSKFHAAHSQLQLHPPSLCRPLGYSLSQNLICIFGVITSTPVSRQLTGSRCHLLLKTKNSRQRLTPPLPLNKYYSFKFACGVVHK